MGNIIKEVWDRLWAVGEKREIITTPPEEIEIVLEVLSELVACPEKALMMFDEITQNGAYWVLGPDWIREGRDGYELAPLKIRLTGVWAAKCSQCGKKSQRSNPSHLRRTDVGWKQYGGNDRDIPDWRSLHIQDLGDSRAYRYYHFCGDCQEVFTSIAKYVTIKTAN